MTQHLNRKKLQRRGVNVLVIITCHNKKLSDAVTKVKGFQVILTATKRYHSSAGFQTDAINALWSLVSTTQANADLFVVKHDGIPFILERMKRFPHDTDLIEIVCDILSKLSKCEKFRQPLLNAKAGSALMNAFERHGDNEEIKGAAREAMKNLMKE